MISISFATIRLTIGSDKTYSTNNNAQISSFTHYVEKPIHEEHKAIKERIKLSCSYCGKTFYMLPSDYKDRKKRKYQNIYCSAKCSHDARKIPITDAKKVYSNITCKTCGKKFRDYTNINRKYCSVSCYSIARTNKRKAHRKGEE